MMRKSSAATADGKYLYRNYRYYPHTINRGAAPAIQRPEGMTKKGAGNGKNDTRYQPALGAAGLRDPKGGSRLSPGGGQYAGGGAMRKPGGDDLAAVHRSAGPAEDNLSFEVIDSLLRLWAGAEWAEIRAVWYSPVSAGFGLWEAPVDLEGERIMRGTRDDTVIDRIGRCIHSIGEPHTGVIRRLYVGMADVRRWERAAALRAFAAAWQAE